MSDEDERMPELVDGVLSVPIVRQSGAPCGHLCIQVAERTFWTTRRRGDRYAALSAFAREDHSMTMTIYHDSGSKAFRFANNRDLMLALTAIRSSRAKSARGALGATVRQLTVFAGTWNLGSELPDADELGGWLAPNAYDVYVVGVQEADFSAPRGVSSDEHWFDMLATHIGPGFVLVSGSSLWSLRLAVFVRAALLPVVSDVRATREATGIAHLAGNKGGLGVSLTIGMTSFLFVTAHLAAHEEYVERRNSDAAEIVAGLSSLSRATGADADGSHDLTVWMGDLNYRVQAPLDDVLDGIAREAWDELLEADQLCAQIDSGDVFAGFTDVTPAFPPTFKLTKGRDGWSADAYKRKRVPSWTDRVLYRHAPHLFCRAGRLFAVHDALTSSDHAPVGVSFAVRVLEKFSPRALVSADQMAAAVEAGPHASLVVTELAGHDLVAKDLNGFSDPYVTFVGRALFQSGLSTRVIKRTLDPEWADEDVPVLRLALPERELLALQSVLLIVIDEDRLSRDDPMGQGWLPLAIALAANGKPVPFEVALTHGGKPAGRLTGLVTLTV